MQLSLKKEACEALGGKNFFTQASIAQYLSQSEYSQKKHWAEDIQKSGKLSFYVTTLENDVTKHKRHSFRLLRQIQLKEIMTYVQDKELSNYIHLQLYLHDGSSILNRDEVLGMVNRLELKILKKFSQPEMCKCEIKHFILAVILCSNKHFIYEEKDKKMFLGLCQLVC